MVRVEDFNPATSMGLPSDEYDKVSISHGNGTLNLSPAQAYMMCYDVLVFLQENRDEQGFKK